MKDTILNIFLIFVSKKTRIKLMRKLDLLNSLTGKRCLRCREFLYDVAFGNNLCCKCSKKWTKSWIDWNVSRQEWEVIKQAKKAAKEKEEASKIKQNGKPVKDIARGRG